MLKLTKTAIGLLTNQYRSVLRKCFLLNLGLFVTIYVNTSYASISQISEKIIEIVTPTTYDGLNGFVLKDSVTGKYIANLYNSGYGRVGALDLYDGNSGKLLTLLSADSFKLNGSAISATGIVANAIQNSTALITSGGVYDALNYYYTFRVDESEEVTDSASFFQKDFSTLQKVDLHIKNPTHLGAFAKCNEVCPRPSERFSLSLSQEQMLKNDASVDAGTFSICSLQIENVNEKLSNVFDVYGGVKC